MSAPKTVTPEVLTITDRAAKQVRQLIETEKVEQKKPNLNLMLRVFIQGGGCSGLQYGLTFAESVNPNDRVIEKAWIVNNKKTLLKVLVDAFSYQHLVGATIDYESDLQGERFIFDNPHAVTTCGCGASFAINEDDDDEA